MDVLKLSVFILYCDPNSLAIFTLKLWINLSLCFSYFYALVCSTNPQPIPLIDIFWAHALVLLGPKNYWTSKLLFKPSKWNKMRIKLAKTDYICLSLKSVNLSRPSISNFMRFTYLKIRIQFLDFWLPFLLSKLCCLICICHI